MKKVVFLAGALLFPACADPQIPVKWSAEIPGRAGVGKPGQVVSVRISAKIDRGWYVYSFTQIPGGPVAARVWLPAGQLFSQAGAVTGPRPETGFDSTFKISVEKYRRAATFVLPVRIRPDAPHGSQPIEIHVSYQACNDRVCLPPRTVKLSRSIEVTS